MASFDHDALTFAGELARDAVMGDPSDYEIVLAVTEHMYGDGGRDFSERLQRGVVAVFDEVASADVPSDDAIKIAVRRAQNLYGLC